MGLFLAVNSLPNSLPSNFLTYQALETNRTLYGSPQRLTEPFYIFPAGNISYQNRTARVLVVCAEQLYHLQQQSSPSLGSQQAGGQCRSV